MKHNILLTLLPFCMNAMITHAVIEQDAFVEAAPMLHVTISSFSGPAGECQFSRDITGRDFSAGLRQFIAQTKDTYCDLVNLIYGTYKLDDDACEDILRKLPQDVNHIYVQYTIDTSGIKYLLHRLEEFGYNNPHLQLEYDRLGVQLEYSISIREIRDNPTRCGVIFIEFALIKPGPDSEQEREDFILGLLEELDKASNSRAYLFKCEVAFREWQRSRGKGSDKFSMKSKNNDQTYTGIRAIDGKCQIYCFDESKNESIEFIGINVDYCCTNILCGSMPRYILLCVRGYMCSFFDKISSTQTPDAIEASASPDS